MKLPSDLQARLRVLPIDAMCDFSMRRFMHELERNGTTAIAVEVIDDGALMLVVFNALKDPTNSVRTAYHRHLLKKVEGRPQ